MDEYAVDYIKHAMFTGGEIELSASATYNDQGLSWDNHDLLTTRRQRWFDPGFVWDGVVSAKGVLWGGCIESVNEMLRHSTPIPFLEQFAEIVLMLESSEELPSIVYVHRVSRALGKRGILSAVWWR